VPEVMTAPCLRECPACGLMQVVPAMAPRRTARCLRCKAMLRHTRTDPLGTSLALNVASLVLLIIAATSTMMQVSTAGMVRQADLFSGPIGLEESGMWELAVVVLFATMAAPLLKLSCMTYVLLGLRFPRPPRHLRLVFVWTEHLRPWSMVEVYLLGVAVAYVKLVDIVTIDIGYALYALVLLMLTMVAADAALDHQAVWEAMAKRGIDDVPVEQDGTTLVVPSEGAVACHTCGLVALSVTQSHARCLRCNSVLHARKPNAISRTAALMIAALVLYIPANLYPVLTVISFGAGAPSTILGGVVELLNSGMFPLAVLVFFASVMVPVLKLVGLTILLISTKRQATGRLRDRTILYRIVNAVGRWSMIDIFMESILVALVQFGAITSIEPGFGAIAFAGVVIITMFAAESFDPRLMWDEAAAAGRESPA
jgi:paraquat-inducible protein A